MATKKELEKELKDLKAKNKKLSGQLSDQPDEETPSESEPTHEKVYFSRTPGLHISRTYTNPETGKEIRPPEEKIFQANFLSITDPGWQKYIESLRVFGSKIVLHKSVPLSELKKAAAKRTKHTEGATTTGNL